MKKLFLLFVISLFNSQCGYEKVYSGKNLNLSIKKIKKENNFINNELSDALLNILSKKKSDNSLELEIKSNKFTEVKSKDSEGNPYNYVLKIETKIIAIDEMGKEYTKIFTKKMNYNNNDDKFQLSQYINEIEKILIEETVEEIVIYLTNIK